MINSVNTTLDCSPQRFHRVDVDNATNILFGRMLDYFVSITKSFNVIIARQFVSIDHCFIGLLDIPFNHWQERMSLNIGDYFCDSVPISFNHAHDNCFTTCTTTSLPLPFPTDVSLVNFNLSRERIDVIGHKFADFFEHSPSCFICNSKFSLKLFSRNPSFSRGH